MKSLLKKLIDQILSDTDEKNHDVIVMILIITALSLLIIAYLLGLLSLELLTDIVTFLIFL